MPTPTKPPKRRRETTDVVPQSHHLVEPVTDEYAFGWDNPKEPTDRELLISIVQKLDRLEAEIVTLGYLSEPKEGVHKVTSWHF
jgi:hypothetical protein